MKVDVNMYSYKNKDNYKSFQGTVVNYDKVVPFVLLYHPYVEEWYLTQRKNTTILGQGLYEPCPDLTALSTEEFFQYSLVWNFPHDIHMVQAIQEMFKLHQDKHFNNFVIQVQYE